MRQDDKLKSSSLVGGSGSWVDGAVGEEGGNELHGGSVEFKFTVEHSREKGTGLAAGCVSGMLRVGPRTEEAVTTMACRSGRHPESSSRTEPWRHSCL